MALRSAAVASRRRDGRARRRREAPRPASFGPAALAVRKATHRSARRGVGGHREAAVQCAWRTSTSSLQLQAAIAATRSNGGVTTDFAWAIREAAEILVQLFHPDDAASRRGVLGWARPCDAGGRGSLAGHRARPAGRRDHHAAGAGQWPQARRRDGCARRRQARKLRARCWPSRRSGGRLTEEPPKKSLWSPQRIVNVVA